MIKQKLEDLGYANVRTINGFWYGTMRMMYTVGVFCEIESDGCYGRRMCFSTQQNAKLFLADWDGKTLPIVGDDGCTAIK